jgi:hypothetical protein
VNILLDESVDRGLARELVGHSVTTVQQRGWAGIKNGDLLARAEKEFEAFVTVDRKLADQQDLATLQIAVVLLRAQTNRLADLRALVPELLQQLALARAGALTVIQTPR